MIKPKKLKTGDKVAIVSLSWGGLGDEALIHKYYIARERLENDFGLEVMCMPHALKGRQVVVEEEHLTELPVIYNVNIGHAKPIGILPYGIETELNCNEKTIRFLESPTIE